MDHSEHARRRITEHWTTNAIERIAWADLETRHLWNIARMIARAARRIRRHRDDDSYLRERWHDHIERRFATRIGAASGEDAAEIETLEIRRRQAHALAAVRSLDDIKASMEKARQKMLSELSMAIDELDYRGALPTWDDLRVAWDRACGGDGGPNVADDPEQRPWCLIELWVGFRGEPTTSAEWEAQRSCSG